MSTDLPPSAPTDPVSVPPARRGKVSLAGVLTGIALGGCVAFGMLWQTECRRAAYLQAQIEPLKAEAARYRVGLQEEIARTMRLAEELKAKQAAAVSAR